MIAKFARAMVIGTIAITAFGAAAAADSITDRQEDMKAVGKAMGALAAIAKKEASFDAAVVSASGNTIAEKVKEALVDFPEGSQSGTAETWAKPEIWANMDDFKAKAGKAEEAAMAMAAVADEADFGTALGVLGGTCKACHEDYRRPKQ